MPIEGFDYKAFATDLAKQAYEVLVQNGNAAPSDLTEEDKKYIVETVQKFCFMAGEALSNDAQLKFNADQASIVTQFIGEWTFHKSIDLMKGQIPQQIRESVLQIIAANIFNTAKLAIIKSMPDDAIISLVEEKVKRVYEEELGKHLQKGNISQEQFNAAVNSSNLNDMVQKNEDESKLQSVQDAGSQDKKVLKFAALSIVLKNLPEEQASAILQSLPPEDANHVFNYMKMNNIEDKIDHSIIISALAEIKELIPVSEEVKTERMIKRYKDILNSTSPAKLSKIAMNEREALKEFILDSSFAATDVFSPYVVKSLIKHVENKINDN